MSISRRLAAGLPAVGATVFAALALTGAPALAAETAAQGAPAAMTSPEPANTRGNAGYGTEQPAAPTGDVRGNSGYSSVSPETPAPTTSAPAPATSAPAVAPATSSPAPNDLGPTGGVASAPGSGVDAATFTPSPDQSVGGAGVDSGSSGGTLPLTGAPLGGTLALGGLLVAAGGAAVYYTRRRRA
ncbi:MULTISPECIES: hypothetical protein [Actinoplanes]|uniref:hypothetical protein n=1 Tax=Actinoplanes TaxID=1865 RepID=UPI000696EB29|nr:MULTISPECIES: hypothetical protein [Actinoplanes]GLY04661.1 hypothetical protein Acsp01_50400 [Actinoplanes sp. NBRC 101535]